MPVTCKQIDGSWRLVDKDGSVKHKAKHSSRSSCMKQARAMNANMKLSEEALVFIAPDDSYKFSNSDGNRFSKELIYEGTFEAKGNSFDINRNTLEHWASEHRKLTENGVKVPVPVEHTNDPEKNRGYLTDVSVMTRPDGKASLVGQIEFTDEEAAKLAKRTDVSIYSPPSYKDGAGNEYVHPIRHVALTSYPVVPGLDGFTPIAASLVSDPEKTSEEEPDMALADLAKNLGLELSEDTSDDKVSEAIVASFQGLQKKIDEMKPAPKAPVNKMMRNTIKENRELKLSQLVDNSNITQAVAKNLETVFCTDDQVSLCLSEDHDDLFDAVVKALRDNEPVSFSEGTPAQASGTGDVNPLIADAERRAAAARK